DGVSAWAARAPAEADAARAAVGADDGPDLGHEGRLAAEDLPPAGDEAVGDVLGLDVLHDPGVGGLGAALVHVLDHALEGALGRADALDGRDLAVEREDRLDLQRRA